MRTLFMLLVMYLFSFAYEFVSVYKLLHEDNNFLLKEFHLQYDKLSEFLIIFISAIYGPILQCKRIFTNNF